MIASQRIPPLSLREKAAQVLMVDFRFRAPDYDRITRLIRAGVGGVCLFGGSIFDTAPTVNSFQRLAKLPLLVAADFERGAGQQVRGATLLPPNMALGATGSDELAELMGAVTAREARALGVSWLFAPVVDVQSNPQNPIINVRSFGAQPESVTALARAFLRGAHGAGALVCLKHFPGHGDVDQDSHLVLPRISRDPGSLEACDIRPFAELAAETDAVMTAHLLVEAFDPARPASLSREVTTRLLREKLRFQGLVITDALIMGGAIEQTGPREAVVAALAAGADIVLYPPDPGEAIDAIVRAVESEELPEAVLDGAIDRQWRFKAKAGLLEEAIVDAARVEEIVGCREHREAARRIAEAAITRVFDRASLLPLREPVRCVTLRDPAIGEDAGIFEGALAARGRLDPESRNVVVAVFSGPRAFSGRAGPDADRLADVRTEISQAAALTGVSFGSPYVIRAFPDARAFVCAYGAGEDEQTAAARALCGEIPFNGRLPVPL